MHQLFPTNFLQMEINKLKSRKMIFFFLHLLSSHKQRENNTDQTQKIVHQNFAFSSCLLAPQGTRTEEIFHFGRAFLHLSTNYSSSYSC